MLLVSLFLSSLAPLQAPPPPALPAAAANVLRGERASTDPSIWCVYPGDAPVGDVIIILGTNFDLGTVVFFDAIPSVPLLVTAIPDLPKIGTFAWMYVPVPPSLLGGRVNLTINYLGATSKPVPFTIRLLGGGYSQGPDPELWCPHPAAGSLLSPVVLFGYGFTDDSVPYFGRVPSLNLGHFDAPSFPLFGSFSMMVTVVPPSLPGSVSLTVHTNGDVTEAVPFRIR